MKTRVIVSAVIQRGDTFLILQRADNSEYAARKWELVSGFIEKDETAEETIKREVGEETSLRITEATPLPIYESNDVDGRWVVIPFLVEVTEGEIIISSEHQAFRWVTADEMKNIPELKDENRLIALLR